MIPAPLIQLESASFGYQGVPVVTADRLVLQSGSCLGIFGPNGAGKTTLVRGITGLRPPLSGEVRQQPDVRIAYLPQHASMQSHWPLSGFDAAAMVVSSRRRMGWLSSADRAAVHNMMRRLNVENLAAHQFFTLSGGQQQRVLLAAAMAVDPQVLVLDEPTVGLDVHSRRMLLDMLNEFTGNGLCSVMISHEIEDLLELCGQVAWLHPGEESQSASHVELVQTDQLIERLAHHR